MLWNIATAIASPTVVFTPVPTPPFAQPFTAGDGAQHAPTGLCPLEDAHSIHPIAELFSTWHQSAFKSLTLSLP